MRYSKQEVEEARLKLLEIIHPGDKIYTVLRHVSRSGMSRDISVVVFDGERKMTLDWDISRLLDYPLAKGSGVKVSGCGMDMGFHLVYSLGRVLFKDWLGGWECIGENCPFNEHFNDPVKYPRKKGFIHDGDTGYTLRHEWL